VSKAGAGTLLIRSASEADLPAILAIYNDAVLRTTAIWMDVAVDLAERRDGYEARRTRSYPVMVAETGGAIAGYGSFGDFRPFEGYIASRSSIRFM
jgi:phosphinothricin acetyltransferase